MHTPTPVKTRYFTITDAICIGCLLVVHLLMEIMNPLLKIGMRYPIQGEFEYSMPNTIDETVPMWLLAVLMGPVGIAIHFLIDYFSLKLDWSTKRHKAASIKYLLSKLFWGYGAALLYGLFFTEILKQTAGSMRPDFLARCKPNWFDGNAMVSSRRLSQEFSSPSHFVELFPSSTELSAEFAVRRRLGSVYNFPADTVYGVCTGDIKVINEGRKSFPSGHAFSAFYFTTFLALMIQTQFKSRQLSTLFSLLQVLLVSLGAFVAASRYIDYRHRPTDIIVGSLLGIAFAVFGTYMSEKRGCVSKLVDSKFVNHQNESVEQLVSDLAPDSSDDN